MKTLTIEFAGASMKIESSPFVIGRDADLSVDDNPYLHRRFLELRSDRSLWWIANVGTANTATLFDVASGAHAWLPPGAWMPIVFSMTRVQFSAGPTNYELDLFLEGAPYEIEAISLTEDGTTTLERMTLTADQRLMLVVLAEQALRRSGAGQAEIPTAAGAAKRLGWTAKKFEKKLDNVCERLSNNGVRGLKGEVGNHAHSRRSRLVQYAIATRLITQSDLHLLESLTGRGIG